MPPANAGSSAARKTAFHILEACRKGRTFEQAYQESAQRLDERDRRLAHELAAGVLRRQRALDARLAPLVSREWSAVPAGLQDVLRMGAYQLQFLDRIPPHAAVATAVNLARELSGDRAAGFVNAVLRRLTAQGGSRGLVRPEGEEVERKGPNQEGAAELAERFSHPEWLVERWVARYGVEDTFTLLTWNDTRPRLAVQPAREDLHRLIPRWQSQGFTVEATPASPGWYVDARRPDLLEGFSEGGFLVQDPGQAMVARFSGIRSGLIYDACAAPGGKTLALSHQGGHVVAGDRSRLRVQRIRQNVQRAGSGREYPVVADALRPPLRQVDAVLLDAPCLGTGTFARHPDARWRVTFEALAELAGQQRGLLESVALLVRPGGMLIYATCSLEPEENECQVEAFLAGHREFHREPNPQIPAELLSPQGDLVILPHRHRMDGAFAARLRRSAP